VTEEESKEKWGMGNSKPEETASRRKTKGNDGGGKVKLLAARGLQKKLAKKAAAKKSQRQGEAVLSHQITLRGEGEEGELTRVGRKRRGKGNAGAVVKESHRRAL